jgi:hypothetical protein
MIIPNLTEDQLNEVPSQAEVKVYKALRDRLPDDYIVFFQVGWILKKEKDAARDGETDFLICHPNFGYLCVEVKGGGIGFDATTNEWFSIDRYQNKHKIKNPIEQALKGKYSILSKLNEHILWRKLSLGRTLRGHALFFPDIGDANKLSRPDMPAFLIGCKENLNNPKKWIDGIFKYWCGDNKNFIPISKKGIDIIRNVFGRSFEALPALSSYLSEIEKKRLILTNEQMRVLDFLRSHRRVAISGGAGTGKTVLALEKARRLASEGFKTLLTCYNRQLADNLTQQCLDIKNLDVMSFHQLCYKQVEKANAKAKRNLIDEAKLTYPGKDYYNVHLPNALAYSLDILPGRYDAIVCDEGQDFREDFWVPIELIVTEYDQSPMYVFFDDNQNLYSCASTFPIQETPFNLSINCRNTKPIHLAAYRNYMGPPVSPPQIDGDKIGFILAENHEVQAKKIGSWVTDLIDRHGVTPGDITVLLADATHKYEYYEAMRRRPLPKPAVWLEEGYRNRNTVLIDTIYRFKGLESSVVILWGLDTIDLESHKELLYVGISRAKSILKIVCKSNTKDGLNI